MFRINNVVCCQECCQDGRVSTEQHGHLNELAVFFVQLRINKSNTKPTTIQTNGEVCFLSSRPDPFGDRNDVRS